MCVLLIHLTLSSQNGIYPVYRFCLKGDVCEDLIDFSVNQHSNTS